MKIYGFFVLTDRSFSLQKIGKPTLGKWLIYLKKSTKNLPLYLKTDIKEIISNDKTFLLLEQRNRFSHGILPPNGECEQLYNTYLPFLHDLIFCKDLFKNCKLVLIKNIQNKEGKTFFLKIRKNQFFFVIKT